MGLLEPSALCLGCSVQCWAPGRLSTALPGLQGLLPTQGLGWVSAGMDVGGRGERLSVRVPLAAGTAGFRLSPWCPQVLRGQSAEGQAPLGRRSARSRALVQPKPGFGRVSVFTWCCGDPPGGFTLSGYSLSGAVVFETFFLVYKITFVFILATRNSKPRCCHKLGSQKTPPVPRNAS